jgi:hypothetical protein
MTTAILTYPIVSIGGYYEDPNGSTGGDFSIDLETSNSCTWLAVDGVAPFVTLVSTYYVAAFLIATDGELIELDTSTYEDADQAAVKYTVTGVREWVAHTDRDDPGSSEVASDIAYENDLLTNWATLEEARQLARAWARDELWHLWYPENWSGGRKG